VFSLNPTWRPRFYLPPYFHPHTFSLHKPARIFPVQETMNIPKSKAEEFMGQSNAKKWHLVCSQKMTENMTAANTPGYYLDQLIQNMDAIEKQIRKKQKNKKLPSGCDRAGKVRRRLQLPSVEITVNR
jgi:hypothetical protein